MPIQLKIQLPCKASELTEAVRSFCEQHGCYDTAVVKVECTKDPFSLDNKHSLEIFTPKKDAVHE